MFGLSIIEGEMCRNVAFSRHSRQEIRIGANLRNQLPFSHWKDFSTYIILLFWWKFQEQMWWIIAMNRWSDQWTNLRWHQFLLHVICAIKTITNTLNYKWSNYAFLTFLQLFKHWSWNTKGILTYLLFSFALLIDFKGSCFQYLSLLRFSKTTLLFQNRFEQVPITIFWQ